MRQKLQAQVPTPKQPPGDIFLQLQAAEAKYFPFFGDAAFQGRYDGLEIEEKIRGMLRVMRSAFEVERQLVLQRQLVMSQSLTHLKGQEGRIKDSILHVSGITEARFKATEEALDGMEALVVNNYGEGDANSSNSEDDSGDTTDLEKAYAVRTEDHSQNVGPSGGD